jgi:hypothetical protein
MHTGPFGWALATWAYWYACTLAMWGYDAEHPYRW